MIARLLFRHEQSGENETVGRARKGGRESEGENRSETEEIHAPRFNIYRDLVVLSRAFSPNSSWFPEIGKRLKAGNCRDKCLQTTLVFVFARIFKDSETVSRVRYIVFIPLIMQRFNISDSEY